MQISFLGVAIGIGIAFRSCLLALNFLVRFPKNYTIDTDTDSDPDKGNGTAEKSMGFICEN
jgi:hypothetical protein